MSDIDRLALLARLNAYLTMQVYITDQIKKINEELGE